jgi:hypothetical protein
VVPERISRESRTQINPDIGNIGVVEDDESRRDAAGNPDEIRGSGR